MLFCLCDRLTSGRPDVEEHVLFYLDVSASMNHDANGIYQAPGSPDHGASSIKKARELIPPLCLSTLKRGGYVTIVTWSAAVNTVVEFTPDQFTDTETGQLIDDSELLSQIRNRTSEAVFKASGKTNTEAALLHLSSRVRELAERTSSSITVWFMTDGEENMYVPRPTVNADIPSNPNHAEYGYFHFIQSDGITLYQKRMTNICKTLMQDISDKHVSTEFHVCHVGAAHAAFLRVLRENVNGHFHAVADISAVIREMESLATTVSNTNVTISFSCGDIQLPSAAVEAEHVAVRIPSPFHVNTVLRSQAKISISDRLFKALQDLFKLEPELATIIHALTGNITSQEEHWNSYTHFANKKDKHYQRYITFVENQVDGLARMLEQYQHFESGKYDAAVLHSHGLLRERDLEAISAGLESMKVRLGSGFVSPARFNTQIQRILISQGSLARKMLNRVCLVAETVAGDHTSLSLFIIEGDILQQCRKAAIAQILSKNSIAVSSESTYLETLSHDTSGNVIVDIRVTVNANVICERLPLQEIYPTIVAGYSCKVISTDLQDACKRMFDPLTYTTFLELIRDHNTLPAALYTLADTQTLGLLFDGKEFLYVISGGVDQASWAYFRVYWKLAQKEHSTAVQLPGGFYRGNSALPLAPEPLTNLVLANLMPGLLSEVITGTPLAPLPSIINIYGGYFMMHMRVAKHSSLDICRMGEILSTMFYWIKNPSTTPSIEEFREMVGSALRSRSLPHKYWTGKRLPVKAFIYFLLDDEHSPNLKLQLLQEETFRRYLKQIVCITPTEKEQISIQVLSRTLLAQLCEAEHCTVPQTFAQNLSEIAHNTSSEALHSWLLFVWSALATFPLQAITEEFQAFRFPFKFESHVKAMVSLLDNPELKSALLTAIFSWLSPEMLYNIIYFDLSGCIKVLHISPSSVTSSSLTETEQVLLYPIFHEVIKFCVWVPSSLTVEPAPDNTKAIQSLTPEQLGHAKAAARTRKKLYKKHTSHTATPGFPKLESGNHHVIFQPSGTPEGGTKKPRIIVATLGDSCAGKSTTLGHLISDLGGVDEHQMDMLMRDAASISKGSDCFAWILNRLRQERERSTTIENHTWTIEISNYHVCLLDSPGHKRFIKNITSGLSQADACVLCVSATQGEFEMSIASSPASAFSASTSSNLYEMITIAWAMGVEQFIVLVNKMDTVSWSQKRFEEVSENVCSLVQKITGLKASTIPVVPTSAWHGENLFKCASKVAPWYTGWMKSLPTSTTTSTGFTLVDALSALTLPGVNSTSPRVRVPLSHVRALPGIGLIGIGKVLSGSLAASSRQRFSLAPSLPELQLSIGTIEMFRTRYPTASAGNLVGVQLLAPASQQVHIKRGSVLCDIESCPPPVLAFEARVVICLARPVLAAPNSSGKIKQSLRSGFCGHIHAHCLSFTVVLSSIIHTIDPKTKKVLEEHPDCLQPGQEALVLFLPTKPVCIEPFTTNRNMGRFILHDGARTVAIGIVTAIRDPPATAPPLIHTQGSTHKWGKKH
ncbi:elongation factor 1-alpha [Pelomyxa schiedti]|nr:elongation factor 1-alpha [Pelomyxa schiedti]